MRNVLITGTSSGFGLVATVELARRGWRVFATMRDTSRSGPLAAAATAAGVSSMIDISPLDVTDASSVRSCAERVLAASDGRLDAVVHNAGVAVGAAFEDLPEAEARRVMETNFWGVLALTRETLPAMRARRRGRIVVVSSNSAYAGEPANSIYVASKWAVEGWAESLAYEVAPFHIDVVLVEPGPYRTEIWNSSPRVLPENSAYTPYLRQIEAMVDRHVARDARDPQEVALVIAKALETSRPRFRYPVSPQAHVGHFLRGKLPSRMQRYLITRLLGLHRIQL
ncbi:MAG TPA: SDR family NAD(P)-dependent oxidoreductase [Terriglobales bacterium]|nr:SDR family NAD(P)-dependent oxidoreductase [Terriglobales bacterium]